MSQILLSLIVLGISKSDIYRQIIAVDPVLGEKMLVSALPIIPRKDGPYIHIRAHIKNSKFFQKNQLTTIIVNKYQKLT